MSLKNLIDAYRSIYKENLTEAKVRSTSAEAKRAAAERLNKLKANPSDNPYVKKKEKPANSFGKYTDVWSYDPRADAEFEKANKKITKEEIDTLICSYLIDEGYVVAESSATVMLNHMSTEWSEFIVNEVLSEMRKEDKVAGKKSGGFSDPAFREVKKMIRGMSGTPKGQQKKVPGKKPPRAGEYGSERQSPKTIVNRNKARRQEGLRNMSSRFD